MEIADLWQGAAAALPGMRRRLRELVECESPTDDAAGVNRAAAMAAGWAAEIGGRVKRHRQRDFGDVLELRFGMRRRTGEEARPLLLLGHLDTVWPQGALGDLTPKRRHPEWRRGGVERRSRMTVLHNSANGSRQGVDRRRAARSTA